jgi:hypothetical protein
MVMALPARPHDRATPRTFLGRRFDFNWTDSYFELVGLTGSTNLMALPVVADSLAGRLAVITLLSFAQA